MPDTPAAAPADPYAMTADQIYSLTPDQATAALAEFQETQIERRGCDRSHRSEASPCPFIDKRLHPLFLGQQPPGESRNLT
jgi:hypothetical protein